MTDSNLNELKQAIEARRLAAVARSGRPDPAQYDPESATLEVVRYYGVISCTPGYAVVEVKRLIDPEHPTFTGKHLGQEVVEVFPTFEEADTDMALRNGVEL